MDERSICCVTTADEGSTGGGEGDDGAGLEKAKGRGD